MDAHTLAATVSVHDAGYEDETLIGQIFLHDIHVEAREALVGYHLFERGGSAAAALAPGC